jgi:polyhydroxyalkanoate synthesis regulator phasin
MRVRSTLAALVLALPLALGCSDDGDLTTGPAGDLADLEQFQISASEIAASEFLDDLSEEDKAAMRAALQAAREQIRAIIAQVRAGELSREEARVQIQAVHEELIAKLAEFLTDDQIDRLLDHLRDRRDDRPDLDLTEEQLQQIQALREEFHQFVREIRSRVENGDLAPQEARRLVREKAQQTRRAICGVLTPEQRAQVRFCHASTDVAPSDTST